MRGKRSVSPLREQAEPANDDHLHQRPLPPSAGYLAEIDGEPYPSFPKALWERLEWVDGSGLPPMARYVAFTLARRANKDGKAWPSMASLASSTGLGLRTVKRAVKDLEDAGWLTADRRPPMTTCYRLKSPSDHHCRECWATMPRLVEPCPSCGACERRELPLPEPPRCRSGSGKSHGSISRTLTGRERLRGED